MAGSVAAGDEEQQDEEKSEEEMKRINGTVWSCRTDAAVRRRAFVGVDVTGDGRWAMGDRPRR